MSLNLERIRRLLGWTAVGAVGLAAACGDDDDEKARVRSGATDSGASGIGGKVTPDARADTSAGGGGSSGTGGAAGTGGVVGTGAAAGTGGASGTGAAAGSGGAGTGGSAGGPPDANFDGGPPDAPSGDACPDCWMRDLFPPTRPATITVTGTIRKNDNVCVIVFGGGQCLAQNSPPCNPSSGQTSVMLDLTLDANGKLIVEAPYQDMCAQDYFCAISGPSCPIPTSYEVPTDTTFSYAPRSTDRCRRNLNGTPYNVEHVVGVRISGRSLIIDQLCTTHMLNQSSQVVDVRDWTTTINL
jgi:hypothetical protein